MLSGPTLLIIMTMSPYNPLLNCKVTLNRTSSCLAFVAIVNEVGHRLGSSTVKELSGHHLACETITEHHLDVQANLSLSTSATGENVEKVKEMIMNDRRITIREVADEVSISIGSCH